MRKLIALFVIAGSAILIPAFASGGDVKGPACSDITGGSATWLAGFFGGLITLDVPSCKSVDYTVDVYSDVDMRTSLASLSATAQANGALGFGQLLTDTDGMVCIVVTTS